VLVRSGEYQLFFFVKKDVPKEIAAKEKASDKEGDGNKREFEERNTENGNRPEDAKPQKWIFFGDIPGKRNIEESS
jgi:hypothetical protein